LTAWKTLNQPSSSYGPILYHQMLSATEFSWRSLEIEWTSQANVDTTGILPGR